MDEFIDGKFFDARWQQAIRAGAGTKGHNDGRLLLEAAMILCIQNENFSVDKIHAVDGATDFI